MTPRIPELKGELVAAAGRQSRRRVHVPGRAALVAVAGGLLVAGAAGAATGVFPIGTEVPTPREEQSDGLRYTSDRTVVAAGETPHAGQWRLLIVRSSEGPCLGFQAQGMGGPRSEWQPVEESPIGEGCAPGSRDFEAGMWTNPDEPLVYGRAPEQAAAVRVTAADGSERTGQLQEGPPDVRGDFYVVALPAGVDAREIGWVDTDGRAHGRIALP
jgi:hypothetical protein